MKIFLYIVVQLLMVELTAQRKFNFQTDDFKRGELERIKITPDQYEIFVRQICIQERTQNFSNCPLGTLPDSLTRVEIEYLLKSKTSNRVIYITNYPDQYEHLIANDMFDIVSGTVVLNPWYFSKFFIGTYDDTSTKIVFKKSGFEALTIKYSYSGDSIFFDQLQIPDRPKPMDINAALSPKSLFVKQAGFKWLFKNTDITKEAIPLLDDAIFISRKKPLKGVFFRLSKQWEDRSCCFIYYKINRLVTLEF